MAFLPGQIGGGSAQLTPEQVERIRLASQEAASRGTDTSPVAHWAAALARGIDAYGGYRGQMRANEQEAAGLASADEYIQNDPVLASILGGDVQPPQGVQSFQEVMPGSVPQAIAGQHQVATQPGPEDLKADPSIANYFAAARQAESGGNDAAKNPLSSATGRYQFIQSTWDGLRKQYPELGLTADGRTDPAQQERAMRRFTADNANVLQNAGIPVDGGSLYAAHFLGAGGATNVLSRPDNAPVAAIVGEGVVKANPFLGKMSVGDFKQWAAKKGGGSAPVSSGQFAPAPQQAQSPNIGALAQAQANPWVAKKYGGVIDAVMQQSMGRDDAAYKQQLAQQDPQYQAQLQQMQLQNEAMMNPAPAGPIEVGGVLLDPNTYQPLFDSRTNEPPASIQALQFRAQEAGLQPGTPEYQQFMVDNGGGVNVSVGGNGEQMGTVPAGYAAVADPNNPSGWRLEAIPGGPAEMARDEAGYDQAQAVAKTDQMLNSIDGIINDPSLDNATGWMAWSQNIPGTDAYRFGTRARQLEGQAFLQAFESLKGGGQITEIEGQKATDAMGRLDTKQSPEDYREALNDLKEVLTAARTRASGGVVPEPTQEQTAATEPVMPAGIDPVDWEYMTPEERALFQ